MFSTSTFLTTLVLAAAATAGPTLLSRDDGLATFCFADSSCFQASAVPAGCVDLPLFSQSFQTASLSAPGVECILSPERGCTGNTGLTGILSNAAGTVQLSTLGVSTVASFLCTPDADLINLCFPAAGDCYQATTITNGCANLPRFSDAFTSTSLTTVGTECTLFEEPDCAGASAVVSEASVSTDLGSIGLDNVGSFSCTNA
ncbi:hypothetical protein C8R46DRAFT_1059001 [Mycena filopes]|nr:hypothetical protein C8R46DRAFT_1059001 [Mycena filopes]